MRLARKHAEVFETNLQPRESSYFECLAALNMGFSLFCWGEGQ